MNDFMSPLPLASASAPKRRLRFIDGLRAIAAVWVVLTHFYHNSPYVDYFSSVFPSLLCKFMWKGYLGVVIFFVISGFVIALSLAQDHLTPRYAVGFAVRRYVRLFPPYIAVVLLWIATTAIGHLLIPTYALPQPTLPQFLSHLAYCQNLLGLGDIVGPTWTLCLEFQFYLFYAFALLLMLLRRRWLKCIGVALFVLLTAVSLSILAFRPELQGLLLPKRSCLAYWYLFFFGNLAAWSLVNPRWQRIAWGLLAGLAIWLVLSFDENLFVGTLTLASILAAIRWNRMSSWLSNPVIQYLGSRSYSIYLTNWGVGMRLIDFLHRFLPSTPLGAWTGTLLGLLATLLASELLYRFLEKPSLALTRRLKPFFSR